MKHWMRLKALQPAVLLGLSLMLSACAGADTETPSGSAETEASADMAAGESGGQETASEGALREAQQAAGSSPAEASLEETEPETYDSTEDYPGTVAVTGVEEDDSPYFGIMHAKMTGVQRDEQSGARLYTLQDQNDPENAWAISDTEIGDMEVDAAAGSDVVLFFHGDIVSDSENVRFIAVVPDGTYTIRRAEGTTTHNAMSSFSILTREGETLSFLKDNCEIEESAMEQDSGDRVVVYYAQLVSEEGMNYPLKIYRAAS